MTACAVVLSERGGGDPVKAKSEIAFCTQPWCGHPQTRPGHPRKGSVQVKAAGGDERIWLCSWRCVARYALRREMPDLDGTPATTPEGRVEQLLAAGYPARWIATELGEPLSFVLGVLDRFRAARGGTA